MEQRRRRRGGYRQQLMDSQCRVYSHLALHLLQWPAQAAELPAGPKRPGQERPGVAVLHRHRLAAAEDRLIAAAPLLSAAFHVLPTAARVACEAGQTGRWRNRQGAIVAASTVVLSGKLGSPWCATVYIRPMAARNSQSMPCPGHVGVSNSKAQQAPLAAFQRPFRSLPFPDTQPSSMESPALPSSPSSTQTLRVPRHLPLPRSTPVAARS